MTGQQLLAALQQLPAELLALPVAVATEDQTERAVYLAVGGNGYPEGFRRIIVLSGQNDAEFWDEWTPILTAEDLGSVPTGPLWIV